MPREHHQDVQAANVGHRTTIGCLIFMETHRRIHGGQFGSIPKRLKEWAWAEGGYCLDAPDVLPAGGCEFFDLDPAGMEDQLDEFGHFGLPTQLTVPREPPGVSVPGRKTVLPSYPDGKDHADQA